MTMSREQLSHTVGAHLASSETAPRTHPKILVVDDRSENLVAIKVMLKHLDADLVMVTSGKQALAELLRHQFALILMDVQMPEMDGFETAALIREYEPAQHIPLIFVTAINKDQIYVHKGYELGAIDYVFKPVEPDILRGKVRGFLDMYREKSRLHEVMNTLEKTQEKLQGSYQEIQRAKAYVDNIIGSMAESLIVLDSALLIEGVNPATNRLLGYSAIELIGQPISRVITDETFVQNWASYFSDGRLQHHELTYRAKDGTEIPVLFSSAGMRQENDGSLGFVCLAQDISRQKHDAEQLARARDQALEGLRVKATFLATMSHEIRTPMNGVIGMADFLLESDLNDEQRDYAETLKVSGEALLNLINDILDFSKIEAGKLVLESIPFSLRKVVEEVVDLIAIQAHPKGLEVMALIHGQVPTMVEGDPGRLRQVLLNLLSNAVKFTKAGEVIVYVTMANEDREDIDVHFEVVDTGMGMSEKFQAQLFTPFSQADASTARKFGGTGLGLTICQKLVILMQGQMDCRSTLGGGTTIGFTVRLRRSHAQPSGIDLKPLPSLRVLVAMEHPRMALEVKTYLEEWGSEVSVSKPEDEILPVLENAAQEGHPTDLLILEVTNFEQFGEMFFQQLKENEQLTNLRVMVVTALGRPGDGSLARQLGASAYLTKPIKQQQLYQALCLIMNQTQQMSDMDGVSLVTRHTVEEHEEGKKQRVLLAEDNLVNQKVAVRMLTKLGYQADVVENGQEALNALDCKKYCAVLMDCMMPEMDGYEATQKIRETEAQRGHNQHDIPIIAVTANAFQEDQDRCLASGMDDFIAKPIKVEDLQTVLEKWISVKSPSN